jgi:hypothetical protein
MAGDVWAQEGVVRSSTDQVFNAIFPKMISDLQAALNGPSASWRRKVSSGS